MLAATQLVLCLFPDHIQEMKTPTVGDSLPHNEQNHGNSSQICPETSLLDDARFSLVDDTKHHNFHAATQHHGGGSIYVSVMQSFYCMMHLYLWECINSPLFYLFTAIAWVIAWRLTALSCQVKLVRALEEFHWQPAWIVDVLRLLVCDSECSESTRKIEFPFRFLMFGLWGQHGPREELMFPFLFTEEELAAEKRWGPRTSNTNLKDVIMNHVLISVSYWMWLRCQKSDWRTCLLLIWSAHRPMSSLHQVDMRLLWLHTLSSNHRFRGSPWEWWACLLVLASGPFPEKLQSHQLLFLTNCSGISVLRQENSCSLGSLWGPIRPGFITGAWTSFLKPIETFFAQTW